MLTLYQLTNLYSSEEFMTVFKNLGLKVVLLAVGLILMLNSSMSIAFDVPDNVQAVFVNNDCLDCHVGANPDGGLSLDDAATSETALVGVTANCSNANDVLVVEGNVEASVLHQKLAGENIACGGPMPPQGALISAADLAIIDNWIISIGPAQQFGLFTLSENSINVNEDQSEVTLVVNRELGNQGAVSIDFIVSALAGDSAENGTDFVAQSGTLNFADGETSQQIVISLLDDDIFEGTEVFTLQLVAGTEVGGAVLGVPNLIKINIVDNELDVNPGTFLFSAISYNVDENLAGGILEITVLRTFGATGEVTVDYATSDSNAISGSDYQTSSGTLVFVEGDKNETFTITILDDDVEEESEFFNLTLSLPGGGAELGAPSSVQVNINDNDGNPDGGGDDGSGDDTGGGDDDGGDIGGGDSDSGIDTTTSEDIEFEAAGSLNFLLLALFFVVNLVNVRKRR